MGRKQELSNIDCRSCYWFFWNNSFTKQSRSYLFSITFHTNWNYFEYTSCFWRFIFAFFRIQRNHGPFFWTSHRLDKYSSWNCHCSSGCNFTKYSSFCIASILTYYPCQYLICYNRNSFDNTLFCLLNSKNQF